MAVNAPTPHELVSRQNLQEAWDWLVSHIKVRPTIPGEICIFDNKCWNDNPIKPDLEEDFTRTCIMLGRLYIASQFGDHHSLITMVHGKQAIEVVWYGGKLDRDSSTVVLSEKRFRNHLAEHLAFWIRLALEKKQRGPAYQPNANEFSYSRPHVQPEDKGPDGLYVEILPSQKVEIQSVKSSIHNPLPQISTPQFRASGIACPREQRNKPLLDEFWWHMNCDDGLIRLDGLVDQCMSSLQTETQPYLRLGLIKAGALNAVVVADLRYSRERLFSGFHYLSSDITQRIATYIGAVNWQLLASSTNEVVRQILHDGGVDLK